MNFGQAIESLKCGKRVRRSCWDKNVVVVYQPGYPDGISCNENTAKAWNIQIGTLFKCEPYLQISTANGSHEMWSPSSSDCLAEDWIIC